MSLQLGETISINVYSVQFQKVLQCDFYSHDIPKHVKEKYVPLGLDMNRVSKTRQDGVVGQTANNIITPLKVSNNNNFPPNKTDG